MKIKPGFCSLFCRKYSLNMVIKYFEDLKQRTPPEFLKFYQANLDLENNEMTQSRVEGVENESMSAKMSHKSFEGNTLYP